MALQRATFKMTWIVTPDTTTDRWRSWADFFGHAVTMLNKAFAQYNSMVELDHVVQLEGVSHIEICLTWSVDFEGASCTCHERQFARALLDHDLNPLVVDLRIESSVAPIAQAA